MDRPENGELKKTIEDTKYDLSSILRSSERDFLVRNNGDQVKVDDLRGKTVGLYFSASWCGSCQHFTPKLVEVYNQLLQQVKFEIVYISSDHENESFDEYFSKLPWLAVPFSDSKARDQLSELFQVSGIPRLVVLDENGKILTVDGVIVAWEYGADGYPFTTERIKEIKEGEEETKRNQTLKSLLVSESRDYVVSADGKKVPITELEGKTVALYFAFVGICQDFTHKLVEAYKRLREKGENFEVVLIPLDDDEASVRPEFEQMPWLSLPHGDEYCKKLFKYFGLECLQVVVVVGPDGKTVHSNAVEALEDYGAEAYPFTPERLAELEELQKAKWEAQTLESILVSGDRDFVIGKDGVKIPVSDLVGKDILLYFSGYWCPLLAPLIRAYQQIKESGHSLEVIFVSSDGDQSAFDEFFSRMPWLAIPFGDPRKESLRSLFKVRGDPTAVAIGPKTVSTQVRDIIMRYGAEAYPFTAEHVKEIEARYKKMAEG